MYFRTIQFLLSFMIMAHSEVKSGKNIDKYCLYGNICSYQDIQDHVKKLAEEMPHEVKTEVLAQTDMGHEVTLVKISNLINEGDESSNVTQKRFTVWVDALINPTDWVSLSAMLYLLEKLTGPMSFNKELLTGVDWYLVPLANPSGYEYTTKIDQGWVKNLKEGECGCVQCGVNLNRNFDVHFYDGDEEPCSKNYRGLSPTSEPEVRALAMGIASAASKGLDLYINLQAAEDKRPRILLPWTYANIKCEGYKETEDIAGRMSDAVHRATGHRYAVEHAGSTSTTSGTSLDFAKAVGARYAMTIQLQKASREMAAGEALTMIETAVKRLKHLSRKRNLKAQNRARQLKTENFLSMLLMIGICAFMLYRSITLF